MFLGFRDIRNAKIPEIVRLERCELGFIFKIGDPLLPPPPAVESPLPREL